MLEGKKVLIVDDDPQIAEALTKPLNAAGASVLAADSFDTGLESVKKNSPDVVILDVMLVGKTGLDLAKEIRAMPLPHPYMMILTNSINADHVAEAMETNITLIVQKAEHDPQDIVNMIGQHFVGTHAL